MAGKRTTRKEYKKHIAKKPGGLKLFKKKNSGPGAPKTGFFRKLANKI